MLKFHAFPQYWIIECAHCQPFYCIPWVPHFLPLTIEKVRGLLWTEEMLQRGTKEFSWIYARKECLKSRKNLIGRKVGTTIENRLKGLESTKWNILCYLGSAGSLLYILFRFKNLWKSSHLRTAGRSCLNIDLTYKQGATCVILL